MVRVAQTDFMPPSQPETALGQSLHFTRPLLSSPPIPSAPSLPSLMTKRPHSPYMAFSPETNGATEQMEGREVKRRRSAPSPLDLHVAMGLKPETNIDVIEDGDVLLVVSKLNGEEKP